MALCKLHSIRLNSVGFLAHCRAMIHIANPAGQAALTNFGYSRREPDQVLEVLLSEPSLAARIREQRIALGYLSGPTH